MHPLLEEPIPGVPPHPSRSALAQVEQLHARQIAQVEGLARDTMRSLEPVLAQAQHELARDLRHWIETRPGGDVRWTAHSYRNALSQITLIRSHLNERMDGALFGAMTGAQRLALRHLTEEVARLSQIFEGSTRAIALNATVQIATGRSFIIPRIRTSCARYAGNVATDIRQNLAVAILRGEPVTATVDRLRAHGGPRGIVALRGVLGDPGAVVEEIPEGLFARYRWWAARVVRTETVSAYNQQLVLGMHEAAERVPGLQKRWCADASACPKVCAPIDGQVRALNEPFDTELGPVDQAPAHPNCGCRTGAWKPEWSEFLARRGPDAPPAAPVAPVPAPFVPPVTPVAPVPAPPAAVAPPAPPPLALTPPRAPAPPPPAPPAPTASTAGPLGTPVSRAMKPPTGSFGQTIRAALDAIDSVHGDGKLPMISVGKDPGHRSTLGSFQRHRSSGHAEAIQVRPRGDHPHMTLIHEAGHFLDWSGIPTHHGTFATHGDPRLAEWHRAVRSSRAYANLQALRASFSADQRHVEYLLTPHEVWARAYAQYIATRSERPILRRQLEEMRKTGFGVYYPRQWNDADFAPIAAEFDALFRNLGWMK